MERPRRTQIMHIILCNAKIQKRRKVNKKAGFCGKKTACPLISEYAAGLNVLDCFTLRINTIKYVQAITASLDMEKSANIGR